VHAYLSREGREIRSLGVCLLHAPAQSYKLYIAIIAAIYHPGPPTTVHEQQQPTYIKMGHRRQGTQPGTNRREPGGDKSLASIGPGSPRTPQYSTTSIALGPGIMETLNTHTQSLVQEFHVMLPWLCLCLCVRSQTRDIQCIFLCGSTMKA